MHQFIAVAEEEQFTRAAVRCAIAQSALSTSIRALERDLGAMLFVRTTRRVTLTAAGRALLVEARRTLAAAAAARNAVREAQGLERGSFSLGGVPTFGMLDQAGLIHRFRERHPGVKIFYARGNSPGLIEDVALSRLDLALVSLPAALPAGLSAMELLSRPVQLVCNADHPLAGRGSVTAQDLIKETFVGPPPGTVGDRAIDRVFAAAAADRPVPFEVNDVGTVLDFVEQGLGVALLVADLVSGRPRLCSVPLAEAGTTWRLGAVTPAGEAISPAAREMLGMLRPPSI